MTDLQLACFYALEEMTLRELNEKYFDNAGIGYPKRLMAGEAKPMQAMADIYLKRFPEHILKKVQDYRDVEYSMRSPWRPS